MDLKEVRVRWADTGEVVEDAVVDLSGPDGDGRSDADRVFARAVDGKGRPLVERVAVPAGASSLEILAPAALRPEVVRRPTIRVGEVYLDAAALNRLDGKSLLAIARAVRHPGSDKEATQLARRLSPLLVPDGPWNCLTLPVQILRDLAVRIEASREIRLALDDLWRVEDNGFTEQIHTCGSFEIHYQNDGGPGAVDPSTAAADVIEPGGTAVLASLPAGGVPTYVKRACFWLNHALSTYTGTQFGLRNPAAGGPIRVDIIDETFGGAGPAGFHMGNAMPPELMCAVVVHELYHMVQFQYAGSGAWRLGMTEGGAVFAEDSAADLMNRYLDEAGHNFNGDGYLINPHVSHEDSGFRYKTSLFWRYVAEQCSSHITAADEPTIGTDTQKVLLERCESLGWTSDGIKQAIRDLPWFQDFYEFQYLPGGPDDLTAAETTFGNFTLACLLKDLGADVPDRRFDFMEDEDNIHIDDVIAGVIPGTPLQTTLGSVAITATGAVSPTSSPAFSGSVARFSARYYRLTVDPAAVSVRVDFTAGSGLTSRIVQLALVDEDGAVRDICRTDRGTWSKTVANLRDGKRLDTVYVIVAGAASAGSYTVSASAQAAVPDVMVTRWHTIPTREYEVDSRAWTWVSPDIWVDNDGDGLRDGDVFFNENNTLFVRLTNKGRADASGISVEFDYQDASGGLAAANYVPVRDVGGTVQTLTGLSLAAGATQAFSVQWAPTPAASGSEHFCVRVRVSCPGDPNTDNKRAMSNFGHVIVNPNHFGLMKLIRRNLDDASAKLRTVLVPRLPRELVIPQPDLDTVARTALLPAGEQRVDEIAIQYRPRAVDDLGHLEGKDGVEEKSGLDEKGRAARALRIRRRRARLAQPWPTIDERTLPPGAAGQPSVTVTHVDERGLAQGGVTFTVSVAKE